MLMWCIGIMADPVMIETLKEKFEALQPLMSERLRPVLGRHRSQGAGVWWYGRRHPRDRSFA